MSWWWRRLWGRFASGSCESIQLKTAEQKTHFFIGVVSPSCRAHLRAAVGLESGVSICRGLEGTGLSPNVRCGEAALRWVRPLASASHTNQEKKTHAYLIQVTHFFHSSKDQHCWD